MSEIIETLREHFKSTHTLHFRVLNPDVAERLYAGEYYKEHIYRSYKTWMDLAHILMCKMLTPKYIDDECVELTFKKLNAHSSFHTNDTHDKREKYGCDSDFSHIHKNEEPAFLDAYTKALHNVTIEGRKDILNLGVNRADEFEVIRNILSEETFKSINLTGIDHSRSALDIAQERFSDATFFQHDINNIDTLSLEKFDLIISIGTLQSPGINFKPFFNALVQNYLNDEGSIILGFTNSRWIDGEMHYGAKMRNYSESDLSLLINDIHYCKKYLQQKKFTVRIHGKEYIFLSAYKHKANA